MKLTHSRTAFDAVAVGASAGGLMALRVAVAALPARFPAAVLIVQHLKPHHKSLLAELLGHWTCLPVEGAVDGEKIRAGKVYIAPPDHHLLVSDGRLSLTRSERVHFARPSVDVLFESVAASYKSRAIGVILTGAGGDGATGIRAVKGRGGTTIVQDPEGADHPSMPAHACATGCVDFTLPLVEIGPAIVRLVLGEDEGLARSVR